jgi:hypothetical protein
VRDGAERVVRSVRGEVVALLVLGAVTIWERRSRRSRLVIKLPLFVVCLLLLVWQTYLLVIGNGS